MTASAIRAGDTISPVDTQAFAAQAFKATALDVRMLTALRGKKAHSCFASDDDTGQLTRHRQCDNKLAADTSDTRVIGDDDRRFRLDRVDRQNRAPLLTNRRKLAAIMHE